MIDREEMGGKGANRYESVKFHETESKSLQKSNEISLMEGSFWKKKSINNRAAREYTTESKQERRSAIRKW
jgi:hypothetical protein